MKAAVLYAPDSPFIVEDIDLDPPHEGEVLVKIAGTGICHTDLSAANGDFPLPMPIVLGHEGAGTIEETGKNVTGLKRGDHVILTCAASCGKCRYCLRGQPVLCEVFRPLRFSGFLPGNQTRLRKGKSNIHHFFLESSFAEYAVVPQEVAIKVRGDAPLEKIGILGCGVLTGIGSVENAAQVEAGASVAIFGCGGVGLSAIMAAVLRGAGKIIAVDVLPNKLIIAESLGATHCIDASKGDPIKQIIAITGDGADYSIVAVGSVDVLSQAFEAIRPGGKCIVIGALPQETHLSLNGMSLIREKTIRGCSMGSGNPALDIPHYLDLYMDGKLPLDELITRTYSLDEINEAVKAMSEGKIVKPLIVMD